MDINAPTASQTRENLSAAFDANDFDAFNREYIRFLKQLGSFSSAFSTKPEGLEVKSAMFGEHSFNLRQTNDAQADAMLENSRKASKVFSGLSMEERLDFLDILKEKIDQRKEQIMLTITADTGKPWALSEGEMTKGNEWFNYANDELANQTGTTQVGKLINSSKPLGAVQVIGAYNYPYALTIGGIVGALATGNGVIVTAPRKAPNWTFPFMEAAKDAIHDFAVKHADKPWFHDFDNIAESLVQLCVGSNRKLAANADMVHFVGSDEVGETIRANRGYKPTLLELGGTNVVTVMKSAVTDEAKAQDIAKKIFAGFGPATGQRCTAPRILCVQEGAESVSKALAEICERGPSPQEIGNPFKDGVKMGPLVDKNAHQKIHDAIALAQELGAKVYGSPDVSDNVVPQARNHEKQSFWINPIAIDWGNVDMTDTENVKKMHDLLKGEIFGPLIHIIHPVKDLDAAIHVVNTLDTHNLAGSIFTENEADVKRYQAETNVTSIMLNEAPKDQSPKGPHGHPGMPTIGGDTHFKNYVSTRALVMGK